MGLGRRRSLARRPREVRTVARALTETVTTLREIQAQAGAVADGDPACWTRDTAASSTSARRSSCVAARGPRSTRRPSTASSALRSPTLRRSAPTVRVNVFCSGFHRDRGDALARGLKTGRADKLRSLTPMARIPGPAERRHRTLPGQRRRRPHDRRVHGRRRRLQHGRRLTWLGCRIVTRIPNVGLHVLDVDESLAFYRDLLGMHVVTDSG